MTAELIQRMKVGDYLSIRVGKGPFLQPDRIEEIERFNDSDGRPGATVTIRTGYGNLIPWMIYEGDRDTLLCVNV